MSSITKTPLGRIKLSLITLTFFAPSVGCGSDASNDNAQPDASTAPTKDIVATGRSNGMFITLMIALNAAHLVDDAKGPGPFTVFAPTGVLLPPN